MRRVLILTVFLPSILLFSQTIRDVPPQSNLYSIVEYLVKTGIMDVDEGGYFRGNLLLTKFDLAGYLYRMINYFKLEEVKAKLPALTELSLIKPALTALDERQKRVEQTLEEVKKTISQYEKRINEISTRLSSLDQDIKSLKDSMNNLSVAFANMKQEAAAFDREIINRITDVERRVQELQRGFSSVEATTKKLQETFEGVQSTVKGHETRIGSLETRVQDLSGWREGVTADLLSLKGRLGSIGESLENVSKRLEESVKRLEEVEKLAKSSSEKLGAISEAQSDLNIRLSVVEINQTQFQKDLRDLKTLVTAYRGELESLKENLNNLARRYDEGALQTKGLQDEIKGLASRIEEMNKKLAEIGNRVDNLSSRVAKLEKGPQVDLSVLIPVGLGVAAVIFLLALISR